MVFYLPINFTRRIYKGRLSIAYLPRGSGERGSEDLSVLKYDPERKNKELALASEASRGLNSKVTTLSSI